MVQSRIKALEKMEIIKPEAEEKENLFSLPAFSIRQSEGDRTKRSW